MNCLPFGKDSWLKILDVEFVLIVHSFLLFKLTELLEDEENGVLELGGGIIFFPRRCVSMTGLDEFFEMNLYLSIILLFYKTESH